MKKLLGIVVLGLLLSGNAYAETKIIDTFRNKYKGSTVLTIHTLCIDGYKFITTQDIEYASGRFQRDGSESVSVSTSVNTIQFMIAENGVMVPAKCN
jgi:hypothetical protein